MPYQTHIVKIRAHIRHILGKRVQYVRPHKKHVHYYVREEEHAVKKKRRLKPVTNVTERMNKPGQGYDADDMELRREK